MSDVQTISTREVYENPWISVREDTVRRADGSKGLYGVVDKPAYALVMPLEGDQLCLVEQFRYPVGVRTWEFPQGTAPNWKTVPAPKLAARELREETGLLAENLFELGRLNVAPGLSSQGGRAFVATGLTEGKHERDPEEQDMRTEWVSRRDFEMSIVAGEITDAQSIAAYTLLLLYERRSATSSLSLLFNHRVVTTVDHG